MSIVEPVVVKPDTVSKNASTGEAIAPESTNGTAPKSEIASQTSVTVRNPSPIYISFFFFPTLTSTSPSSAIAAIGAAKLSHRFSAYIKSTASGRAKNAAHIIIILPTIFATAR